MGQRNITLVDTYQQVVFKKKTKWVARPVSLIEYFEKALGRHSGEGLSIFLSFVTYVETSKFGQVF